ncbi:MAG TPA: SGNH/GDSL hydrolase family protein [Ramlibacter sp.]|jgi:lysophospholipase L1-like esterase|uniref:SGNH/GDSL hydrolase family protein n=1 Tax=Ramlibacter sp. TaxID=1917967 RepID=UPI002D36E3AE|nr:SGNH/GDSL hydrolase family protein [Ramlibacter sp.]HZY18431.1 SGNH/GDSL hydrolase family protein [Ramlibacter sp.]
MDRRAATALLFSTLLAGCGGGGGGGSVGASAVSGSAVNLSSNVAAWGDSLTEPYARELQFVLPQRQVFNGGIAGQTSTEIADRQVADTGHRDWINVFWYGMNNQDDPERIKADIARSVATLAPGNTRFLVLSVVNQDTPAERRGGPGYDVIQQLNRELAALYPQNYYDMRSYMVGRADPGNAQDATDQANDVPPSSMRMDHIHLNYNGQVAVARRVAELLAERGW